MYTQQCWVAIWQWHRAVIWEWVIDETLLLYTAIPGCVMAVAPCPKMKRNNYTRQYWVAWWQWHRALRWKATCIHGNSGLRYGCGTVPRDEKHLVYTGIPGCIMAVAPCRKIKINQRWHTTFKHDNTRLRYGTGTVPLDEKQHVYTGIAGCVMALVLCP